MIFKIKPQFDRIIVERIESDKVSAGGIIIPGEAQIRTAEGVVVAIGEGKELKDGTFRPLSVKVGDRIIFERGHAGTEVNVDKKPYVILREEGILGIIAVEADETLPKIEVMNTGGL